MLAGRRRPSRSSARKTSLDFVSSVLHQLHFPNPSPHADPVFISLSFSLSFMAPSFLLLFLLLPLATPQPPPLRGLLLDCGTVSPSPSPIGRPLWLPDGPFISSGVSRTLPLPDLLPTLSTLRSFPALPRRRRKFCYSLPVIRSARYLVRTTYFYGGVNGVPSPPVFDQIVDGTFWTVVNTTADYARGDSSYYEGVFPTMGKKMSVCIAATSYTDSDPFISTLEIILLEGTVYNATDFTKNAMGLISRNIFGYSGPTVRYPDDIFDRYWEPYSGAGQTASNTQNISVSSFWNLPPEIAFKTALSGDQDNNPMELLWPAVSLPDANYYIALYFADTSFTGSRILDVYVNGYSFYNGLMVTSSGLVVFATPWNLSGPTKILFTPDSLLPPLVNAGEIFGLFPLGGVTLTRDVIALESIRRSINNTPLDWNGDPCLPHEYSWTGVTCSEGPKVRVVALNLSSMGLTGSLSPRIANLTALTDISFADNNLTGPIPDFGQLKLLQRLDLQDNQLNGEIPQSLGNLRNLKELYLQNNDLGGLVPANLLINRAGLKLRLTPGNHFSPPPST